MFRTIGLAFLALTAGAQTQIDLRSQAKGVDFTAAGSTKPMKTGTVLPASCGAGEMFFKTNAPAGANLYACAAANVWSVQGTQTIQSNGVTVGTRATTNFSTGPGLLSVTSDTGSAVDVLWALDTAVNQTQPGEQSGAALWCASNSASGSGYACSMTPTVGAYTTGMMLHWRPDVTATGGPTTLNIDTLGATPVKLADGTSDPTPSDIVAGRLCDIWFDGVKFRLAPTTAAAVGAVSDTGVNGMLYRSAPGVGSAATANQMSGPFFCQDTASTAGAYACNLTPAIGGYGIGTTYWFRANTTNGGAATVSFNSLGAKAIKKQSNVDLAPGDVTAGQWVMLTYDGTNMQMLSQAASGSDEIATATPAANAIPKAGAAGTLAGGWLPAPGASSLGGVQAMDCSTTGLVQKINTDGTVTCAADTGGSPTLGSVVTVQDDFICASSPTVNNFCLPWWRVDNNANNSIGSDSWPHIGTYDMGVSSSGAGNYASLLLAFSMPLGSTTTFLANGPWEFHFIFKLDQTTNTRFVVGLKDTGNYAFSGYILGLRYDTNSSDNDAHFMFAGMPADGGGVVSSGVAPDTSWHHFKMYWISANKVGFTLDGGAAKTVCPSGGGCDINYTPSAPTHLSPTIWCGNDTVAAAATVDIDYFGFLGTVTR